MIKFTFLLIFLVIHSTAGVRCDLVSLDCIDYTDSNDINITVPVNTTRIPKTGIKICWPILEPYTPKFGIIFIVDQSVSMQATDPTFQVPLGVTEAIILIDTHYPKSHIGYLGFANGVCDGTQLTSTVGAGPSRRPVCVEPSRLLSVPWA